MNEKYHARVAKLEFVNSQLKRKPLFMAKYEEYIEKDQTLQQVIQFFKNEEEEIITLTREVFNERKRN